jgi:mannose-1-phosphate guanylyltransferase/mannose-1-phosphate guanylyltransferase/mannose-6-phosphate isomerase
MDDPASARVTPVILCGGSGTRLWPLSRVDRLKPLVSLDGGETLLQATAARVRDRDRFNGPIVVAGADDADAVAAQLAAADAAPALMVVEPAARGTAAAIALAALNAGDDAVLLVMPSDHAIGDPAALADAVAAALPLAREEWLVTFGVAPTRPETGYGYIRRGAALGPGLFRVERFVEKPDAATAAAFIADGAYAWNAGIFLVRAGALLAALGAARPDIAEAVRIAFAGQSRADGRATPNPARFAAVPAESIDRAVMERSDRVAVVPVEMAWSDVGGWAAVHALGPADARGNVVAGDVVVVDSSGCLIRSDGPVVAALGVTDLVIVATERAVLVVPRAESGRVKEAIDALGARRTGAR